MIVLSNVVILSIVTYPLDSEEDTGPRLKPVFVSKRDRVTIVEKEKELIKQNQLELEAKKLADERRRQTLKVYQSGIVFLKFKSLQFVLV